MAQLPQNITLGSFTRMAETNGNVTLSQNQIVHGKGGTWLKGAMNIGDARQANARTLQAFRQAITQDPKYADIVNNPVVQAKLGTIDTRYPLSAKTIKDVIQTLNTENQRVMAAQSQTAYINLMKELSPENIQAKLHEALQETPLEQMEIPPSIMKKIVHIVSDPLLAGFKDAGHVPSREEVQAALQQTLQPLTQNLLLIQNSTLSQNIKGIIQDYMISDTGVMSPHDVQANVQMREAKMHNDALAARICSSAPDGVFLKTLQTKLEQAGMPTRTPGKQALNNMLESLKKNIEKAGNREGVLSEERGLQLLGEKLDAYLTSLAFASTLENPQSAEFLSHYIQNDGGDMQVAYLQTIANHLQEIPIQNLTTPASFASPSALQTQLINIQVSLNPTYDSIPRNMLPEGNLGRQNFMDIACGLALSKLDRPQIQQIYDQLSQGTGAALRGILKENSQDPVSVSSMFTLDNLQMQAGIILKKSEEQILTDNNTITPQYLQDPNGLIHTKNNIPTNFQVWTEKFFSHMPLMALTEAQRGMSGIKTTFEKDITRYMHVTLGDTKIPTNWESLDLPPGVPDTDETRKKLLIDIAYNHVAAFLTGNPASTMDTITPEEKKQVYLLTAFISQETSKPGLNITQNAIIEGAETTPISFDEQNKTERFRLSKLENGDIAVQIDLSIGMNVIVPDGSEPIMIDPETSRNESHTVFTLSSHSMQTMARQDWDPHHLNLPNEDFSQNQISDFPPEMRLAPQNLLITGTLSFSAPIE